MTERICSGAAHCPKGVLHPHHPETQPGGKKLRYANSIEVYFNTPRRDPSGLDTPLKGFTFVMRARKNKTAIPKRKAEVYVKVADDDFGPDINPELAGFEGFPGLLKEFGLLVNEKGLPYNSGRAWFLEPGGAQTPVMVGDKQATTKAELLKALDLDPAFRAKAIEAVYACIQEENSPEGILRMLNEGPPPGDPVTPAHCAPTAGGVL